MAPKPDLDSKLATVSEWVLAEFAALCEAARDLGGVAREESGPGVAYAVDGRTIVRLHPKRGHLCVGLPDSMRDDVEALTERLRGQQGAAWFNHTPGAVDRDTVELLLDESASAVAPTVRRPRASATPEPSTVSATEPAGIAPASTA